jgi:protein TonB
MARPPRHTGAIRLVDVAFPPLRRRSKRKMALIGALVAVAIHGIILIGTRLAEPSLESWSAEVATKVHRVLVELSPIEIVAEPPKPPAPEPPPPPPPEPPAKPVAKPPRRAKPSREPMTPKELAQAGKVLTAEATGPVAFDDAIVVGKAAHFVGGVTHARGESRAPVRQMPTEPPRPSRARPVSLAAGEWQCPWPEAADESEINEQTVVLRVRVKADGTVHTVRVVDDPGYGFGAAAATCAKTTRFQPALDAAGSAVEALSPPLRVHFIR